MSRGKAVHRNSSKPRPVQQLPRAKTMADHFKAVLGWKPSTTPFRTTANRECGSCRQIKPGSEFDCPVTPGCPWLNTCASCQETE
jgi:hypothetical protein